MFFRKYRKYLIPAGLTGRNMYDSVLSGNASSETKNAAESTEYAFSRAVIRVGILFPGDKILEYYVVRVIL